MDFIRIDAWPRAAAGKGPAAKLRREGKIPAVAYGAGLSARSLALSPKQLAAALQGPYGRNAVLEVVVGEEKPFPALVCDAALHPVTRQLEHADLLHIDLTKPVEIAVPLICVGKAEGVTAGGVLRQVYRAVPLRCLPADIPAKIELDVTAMLQGDTAKVSDLKLPDGVTVRLAPDQTVVAIVAPEAEKVEEAGVEGAPKPEEGQAGAAPAAEGAAAAAPGAAAAPAKKEKEKEKDKDRDRK
jgi:large subunit ribosomal protein L25